MRSLIRKSSWALLFILCFGVAEAEGVPLNTTDVPVATRSSAVLRQALPQALQQVLIKMSGNTGIMTLPAIQTASLNVDQLVESYRYSELKSSADLPQLLLHVVFDEQALKRLLRGAGQAIWGEQRPLTLVWIAVPQGVGTAVLASADQADLAKSLKARAVLRGVPVMLPTMDLTDQSHAPILPEMPSDQALATLGERYHVSSVLAGVVTADASGAEQVQWQWVLNGSPIRWQSSADSTAQAVTEGLDKAADMMANQLATITSAHVQSSVVLQVSGVEDLDDYVQIVNVLRHLNKVSKVRVANMENNTLLLNVRVVGQEDELVAELGLVKHLASEPEQVSMGVPADLYYHWTTQSKPYDPEHDDTVVKNTSNDLSVGLTNGNG